MERHVETTFSGVAHHLREWQRRVPGPGNPLLANFLIGEIGDRPEDVCVNVNGFSMKMESVSQCRFRKRL
jgi:hypothetical protein